ncbi:MAG: hypothetical protein EA402_10675 [Planctomycetota bacterium]|nr:MAG: hypothetical protein EA402_10675 [Planctomycetota bacterium]
MLSSARRSVFSTGFVTTAVGGAVLSLAAAAPLAAEDTFLGYTDLRLTIGTMPFSGVSGGPAGERYSGKYEFAGRVSLMAIGPVCSVLPINCYTPPRVGSSGTSTAVDSYGSYDDLVVERQFSYRAQQSYSYDWLLGFELSGNTFVASRDNEPEITTNALAITVHVGFGLEIATRSSGRWHWELTPFIGAGFAVTDWETTAGVSDDDLGTYWEIGVRLGTYYTFAGGFQLGAEARYVYADMDVGVFGESADYSVDGLTFNLALGYRF